MAMLRIDGAEHAAEGAQAVVDAALARRDARAAQAETARDAEKARADKAETDLAALRAELTQANSPARVDALVTARLDLIARARRVCGESFAAQGKSEQQIIVEVATKAHPKLKLDGQSDAYVRALFDSAVLAAESDPDGIELLRGRRIDPAVPKGGQAKNDSVAAARADMVRERVEAGRKPLTHDAKGE